MLLLLLLSCLPALIACNQPAEPYPSYQKPNYQRKERYTGYHDGLTPVPLSEVYDETLYAASPLYTHSHCAIVVTVDYEQNFIGSGILIQEDKILTSSVVSQLAYYWLQVVSGNVRGYTSYYPAKLQAWCGGSLKSPENIRNIVLTSHASSFSRPSFTANLGVLTLDQPLNVTVACVGVNSCLGNPGQVLGHGLFGNYRAYDRLQQSQCTLITTDAAELEHYGSYVDLPDQAAIVCKNSSTYGSSYSPSYNSPSYKSPYQDKQYQDKQDAYPNPGYGSYDNNRVGNPGPVDLGAPFVRLVGRQQIVCGVLSMYVCGNYNSNYQCDNPDAPSIATLAKFYVAEIRGQAPKATFC